MRNYLGPDNRRRRGARGVNWTGRSKRRLTGWSHAWRAIGVLDRPHRTRLHRPITELGPLTARSLCWVGWTGQWPFGTRVGSANSGCAWPAVCIRPGRCTRSWRPSAIAFRSVSSDAGRWRPIWSVVWPSTERAGCARRQLPGL